jgi:DcuC family C4-dicarboxylate transporter
MPAPDAFLSVPAALIVLAGILLVIRQVDVRLVLFVCGVLLAALAGRPLAALDRFAETMASANYTVPICCSMGFAFVLKFTGCDTHLVRLLVVPLQRVAPLVVPGGIAVAFIVNTAVISQSSTAATVGPVLIPLLLAAGLTPTMAGAALLIGASVGGELLNAGAPEVIAISATVGQRPIAVIERMAYLAPVVAAVAAAVFWWRSRSSGSRPGSRGADAVEGVSGHEPGAGSREARAEPAAVLGFPTMGVEEKGKGRIHLLKAMIPLLPIALLILDARLPGHLFPRPADPGAWQEWKAIAYAMLIGAGAAMLTAPRALSAATGQFFQGQGFAYAHIISLIVAALTFVEGLKQSGLMTLAIASLAGRSALAVPAAVVVPGSMALLTGSGMAPSVTFIEAFLPHAPSWGVDGVGLGMIASQSAAIGRTCSPAAAVVMVCAALVGVSPLALLRHAAGPLVAAWVTTLAAGFLVT